MTIKSQLTPNVWTGPGVTPQDLRELVAEGFTTIINNRPDHEANLTITSPEAEAVCTELDVDYFYIPMEGKVPLERDVRAFAEVIEGAKGRVFAFCRSGRRSTVLWALSAVMTHSNEDIVKACASAEVDVSDLEPKLSSRRALLEDERDD